MLQSMMRTLSVALTFFVLSVSAPAQAQENGSVRLDSGDTAASDAPPAAEAPAATDRSATGGAQTLDDILRRQRGETVAPEEGVVGVEAPSSATPGALTAQGGSSDSAFWRGVRRGDGDDFTVSIPDKKAAVLVRDGGEDWLTTRSGPVQKYSFWAIGGMIALLLIFFLIRGRIKVDRGMSGVMIDRFSFIERFGHWLIATTFVILALTGFSLLAGREALVPAIDWVNGAINGESADPDYGKSLYASWAIVGKWLHNNLSWAFMLGLVMVFFMWVLRNIPTWVDVKWLLKGGGIFTKSHPSARKFNAGQKLIFWAVILLGGSVSASGLMLLFPYELPMFGKTFETINVAGEAVGMTPGLQTELNGTQEMQYANLWHIVIGAAMTVVIIAHIYIGSIGMQGAFSAMGSGKVDLNWAREHHDLWVEKLERRGELRADGRGVHTPDRTSATPAE